MNIPRYFTEGAFESKSLTVRLMLLRVCTGASSHQYHGLTPMVLLSDIRPNAVPLLSLPAITMAFLIPFAGLLTRRTAYCSQPSFMEDTLIFPFDIISSIHTLSPIVPAITAYLIFSPDAGELIMAGACPVTFCMSDAKSSAAVFTVMASSAS